MMPTPAGQRRFLLQFIARSVDPTQANELGESVPTAVPGSTVYGSIRPLTSREILNASQNALNVTHEIRVLWTTELFHTSSIKYGTRTFDVISIINIEEADRELQILVNELVS